MPIEVQKVQPRGSALSSMMGMFNTVHGTYSAMKGGSGGAEKESIPWKTGTDVTQNALGGQDASKALGDQSGQFADQMDAIMRRAYSLDNGSKAAGMDGELASAGYGAAGAGAAGSTGYGAGAAVDGYVGADLASPAIAALA